MITPKAIHLIIQHFDALDQAVSKHLNRKRPWSEPALTSLLCDLLDQDVQEEENLSYSTADLNQDLAEIDGLMKITFAVDTHEYDASMEHWVTQADLGFVINFQDHLLPDESWSLPWLLQAKRLYPVQRNPLKYTEISRFSGIDPKQQQRIEPGLFHSN